MTKLSLKDIILLGMTNFALYVGAGNIIFPPFIGLQAGDHVLPAAIGFILTGVGLPVIAAIALARVGGVLQYITIPIGIKLGLIMTVLCYLCIGPLYAIPRTATVAYELAITPFTHTLSYLPLYSVIYFAISFLFALYPAKILDTVGKILSPIKISALLILCLTAWFIEAGVSEIPNGPYVNEPFSQGVINGYLTLDTLASLAFGIVIVDAIRSRGINDRKKITHYAIISGSIAGLGLLFIYICLFKLGNESFNIANGSTNGAEVLAAYVNMTFGIAGNIFLGVLIIVACLVTAIGLTCACSSYFSKITKIKYRTYVIAISLFGTLISNLGLTHLIKVSIPFLITIYPMFIVLVLASFFTSFFNNAARVIAPPALLSLAFGLVDGCNSAGFHIIPEALIKILPLYDSNLAWLLPSFTVFVICFILDKFSAINKKSKTLSTTIKK